MLNIFKVIIICSKEYKNVGRDREVKLERREKFTWELESIIKNPLGMIGFKNIN